MVTPPSGDGWKRYPRPIHTHPGDIDADIRNGTYARKSRAHAEAVAAWWEQPRPPLGRTHPRFPRRRELADA